MNRLSRVGIAIALLAGSLWAGGVAEAGRMPISVSVCIDTSSGVVSRVAISGKCVGAAQFWSASKPAPLLCWDASSLNPLDQTRLVSVAKTAGCVEPLRSVPAGKMSLLCADGETGVLRWPVTGVCELGNQQTWVRPASTSNVSTTTTTTSTISTTPVVVPSVSLSATSIKGDTWPKAVTVTANVVGTIYFAEGDFVVKTVSDITSALSHRWAKGTVTSANTPTSIAIDVDAVSNGYYRVFVANSQGVLSAPATNIVTISVTRAAEIAAGTTTTSTTAVPLTCATGGSCTVGVDTGAGGGIIFYYSASPFTSTGSACGTNCHYLEAAPAGWIVSSTPAGQTNCTVLGTTSADPQCEWSGNTSTLIGATAQGTAIGTGYANTSAIILQSNTAGKAATTARAYRGGGKTDWFLPSKLELNQLCRYAKILPVDNDAVGCTGGTLNIIRTGFNLSDYVSSSEFSATNLWAQYFNQGIQFDFAKNWTWNVRPVRAG